MDKRTAVISALFEKKNKRKPKDSKELQTFIKQQGGDEFLKKVDEYINQAEAEHSKQAQKAEHGAKLQYFKSLKNKCAEGEKLVYFRSGGKAGCGCVKAEEGVAAPKKALNAVDKFKAIKKAGFGDTITRIADVTGSQGGFKRAVAEKKTKEKKNKPVTKPATGPKNFKNDYSSKRVKDSENDYLKGVADVRKNCNGSKFKSKIKVS